MTFGFAAAGRAGNASAALLVDGRAELEGVAEEERLGVLGTDGREREGGGAVVAQGVADWEAPLRFDDGPAAAERGGNGFEGADGRAPLLPTAERDDCAVDDFKRNTRLPPVLTVLGDMPGRRPPGPGRAG